MRGYGPNLFILLVLVIGLFAGRRWGILFGLLFGFYLDIVIGKSIGTSTIMLAIIGLIGGYFDKNFSKESRFTIMLMVIGSTCVYETGYYILEIIQQSIHIEPMYFIKILSIETLYNSILTIILYPLIQTLGYHLEDITRGQKILTRYF